MNKTALITGASSGIGLDFARKFAREGYDVLLVARSEGKLRELAAELQQGGRIQAHVMPADLNDPAAPQQIYQQVQALRIPLDVLVNNAGFASYGLFHELDAAGEMSMIQVNIAALTHLTRLFLPQMVARGSGRVVNVASTAAFQPGPLMAVYYASKAYVLHFSEALAEELRGSGVTVTALCPGPTTSGFQARAQMEDSKLVQGGLMSSAEVVEQGYNAMQAGKPVVVTGWRNVLMALAPRFTPRALTTRIVRQMQERASH